MQNTCEKVALVVATLKHAGIACHLFGGWAEEILGLREPCTHGDIDLLYCGKDFKEFDRTLQDLPGFQEVPLKRFRHKRAFQFLGTLCEMTLVQESENRPVSLFWGDVQYAWENPLEHECLVEICGVPISVVSAANLSRYRENHKATQPHRWREPQALETYP